MEDVTSESSETRSNLSNSLGSSFRRRKLARKKSRRAGGIISVIALMVTAIGVGIAALTYIRPPNSHAAPLQPPVSIRVTPSVNAAGPIHADPPGWEPALGSPKGDRGKPRSKGGSSINGRSFDQQTKGAKKIGDTYIAQANGPNSTAIGRIDQLNLSGTKAQRHLDEGKKAEFRRKLPKDRTIDVLVPVGDREAFIYGTEIRKWLVSEGYKITKDFDTVSSVDFFGERFDYPHQVDPQSGNDFWLVIGYIEEAAIHDPQ